MTGWAAWRSVPLTSDCRSPTRCHLGGTGHRPVPSQRGGNACHQPTWASAARASTNRGAPMLASVHYPHLTGVLPGRRGPIGTALAQQVAAVRQTPSWAPARDLRPR
ncbi:MAG: hypothetical protein WKF80_09890 [Thermomicrobiales bacterium]